MSIAARVALVASVCAAILVALLTRPPGPGLDPDAASYLGAGASLAHSGTLRIPLGEALSSDSTSPLSHYPPGLSVAVALGVRAGLPPVQAGRAVMIASAAASAALLALLLMPVVGVLATCRALLGAALLPVIFTVHASILSEPLYLALLLALLLAMVRDGNAWLIGLLAAALVMVRYAGVGVPVAAAAWLGWRSAPTLRARFQWRSLLAGAPPLLLTLLGQGWWQWRLRSEDVSMSDRAPMGELWPTFLEAGHTLRDQLLPYPRVDVTWRAAVAWGLMLTLLYLLQRAWRSWDRASSARALLGGTAALGAALLAALAYGRLTVGPGIPFDDRVLAAVLLLLFVAIVPVLASASPQWGRVLRVAFVGWVVLAALTLRDRLHEARVRGLDFAQVQWMQGGLAHWLRTEGRSHALFSNHPMALWFWSGRPARELPEPDASADDLREFAARMAEDDGVVVDVLGGYRSMMPAPTVAEHLGLREVGAWPEGRVYVAAVKADTAVRGAAPDPPARDPAAAPGSAAPPR